MTNIVAANDTPDAENRADYICDGNADEIEIQAAIDNMPSVGGEIKLLEGTYCINSTIVIDKEIYFVGSGKAAVAAKRGTTIVLSPGSDQDILEIRDRGNALYFIQLRGMKLDGNKAHQSAGRGICAHGDVHDVVIEDLFVYNVKQHGIYVVADECKPHNFRVHNVLIEACGGNGWEDNPCDQIFMSFCYFYDNQINLVSRGDYGIFTSNHFYKSRMENVYFITGHYTIFQANYIDGSGTITPSPGMSLINSDNCIVSGNFSGNAKSDMQTKGIVIDINTNECLIQGNRFSDNTVEAIDNNGSNNMICNNLIS